MYRSPLTESIAIPVGEFIIARVAAAPSPLYPAVPVPAIVEMIPVLFVTTRTTLLPGSVK